VRLPDNQIAFLLDAKKVLMGGAPERFMLRQMQSLSPPGLVRALRDLNSIVLTRHVSTAQSSSLMQELIDWCMNMNTETDPDLHFSKLMGLVSTSILRQSQ
jgi:hypothetical protein